MEAQRSIVILSGNHLCSNPRVYKEACALAKHGFEVEILGGWYNSEQAELDRELLGQGGLKFFPVVDWTLPGLSAKHARNHQRARAKLAAVAYRKFNITTRSLLGYCIDALRGAASKRKADLFIAHSEPALLVARELLEAGAKVGVDMEDWFSEDLLPAARRNRPVRFLKQLEGDLLRGGSYRSCTSRAMSDALARDYKCPAPSVVYNAFPWADRTATDGQTKDRKDRSLPSVLWYSQTLGFGRGLEDLIAALPLVKGKAEIHLRGKVVPDFAKWLDANVPKEWQERVFIHDTVANDELLSRIAEHEIGFAGEQTYARNRDLTVSNKILHYLLGGLAVIASDTAGQREIAECSGEAIRLYRAGDPQDLAQRLNALLASPQELARAKADALRSAERYFCWEQQESTLIESIEKSLKSEATLE